jgi:biotin synthase-like enzyme
MSWTVHAQNIIKGIPLTWDEALAVLHSDDDDLLELLHAAVMIRRHYFGRSVTIHVIQNARSGLCSEDCAFCSQADGTLMASHSQDAQASYQVKKISPEGVVSIFEAQKQPRETWDSLRIG